MGHNQGAVATQKQSSKMAPAPTVGLVGSRKIDSDLQSSDKKTVTEFAFPQDSRTPNKIGIPYEGAFPNKNPAKLGDCYMCTVEDTNLLKVCWPSGCRISVCD